MNKKLKRRLKKKLQEFWQEAAREGEFEELIPDKLFNNMVKAITLVYDQNTNTNEFLRKEGYVK